jgi:hypothetical protein
MAYRDMYGTFRDMVAQYGMAYRDMYRPFLAAWRTAP